MTKHERRHFVVNLLPGAFEQELADLAHKAVTAAERELQQGPRRTGQASEAIEAAREHDAKNAAAQEVGTKIPVWALGYAELPVLKEAHPPREDTDDEGKPVHPLDKLHGTNIDTFSHALLCASLVTPGKHDGADIQQRVAAMVEDGARILDREIDPSALHYKKLDTAAWNVNMGAENLPKDSLVSLLTEAKGSASAQPSDQESAPADSPAKSQPRRTGM